MAKAISMTMNVPGLEIWVNYSQSNLRISTVQWTLPQSNVTARIRLWNAGTLFYDRTVTGPASDTESVPGTHQVVLVDDGLLPAYYTLPDYITWTINIEAIG